MSTTGCSLHWYDKAAVKKQRKVGHVTFVAAQPQQVAKQVEAVAGTDVSQMLPASD